MSHIDTAATAAPSPRALFPALTPLYQRLQPLAETWLRVIAGAALATHGWPKIQDPMRAIGMVESIGFHPGWLWSPALAAGEFFGGLALMLGLLTRFAAAATTVILLVTVYFHWILKGEGFAGAELSLIWSAVTLHFVARGGGRLSLDRLLGREL
ncbi:DoxX family protein [Frigidibacter sp. MR17.14]|uniref:DoxX family protein n=1 Tax=Frigidibacter sp. MR17.14 TaxID=3126509 RepID=UPI00301310E2